MEKTKIEKDWRIIVLNKDWVTYFLNGGIRDSYEKCENLKVSEPKD